MIIKIEIQTKDKCMLEKSALFQKKKQNTETNLFIKRL